MKFLRELGTPRPGTEVSRALRARNPKRVRKESERVSRPGEPQSPQCAAVQKRSFGLVLDSFRTPWRTLWGLWGSPGRDTLSDSFRTLLGPGDLCAWSARSQYESADHLKKCQSPDHEKCRKECFGECRPQTGCRGNCRKSSSGSAPRGIP